MFSLLILLQIYFFMHFAGQSLRVSSALQLVGEYVFECDSPEVFMGNFFWALRAFSQRPDDFGKVVSAFRRGVASDTLLIEPFVGSASLRQDPLGDQE